MLFRTLFLSLFFLIDDATGKCGICQSNFAACHSESTFSLCIDGEPTDSVVSCPRGMVCTDHPLVCVQPIDGTPTCISGCQVCGSQGNVFSCLSKTEFAFCFGEDVPFYDTRGSCLDGYVCDLNYNQICANSDESKPTCDVDFVTTTASSSVETTTPGFPSSTGETTTLDSSSSSVETTTFDYSSSPVETTTLDSSSSSLETTTTAFFSSTGETTTLGTSSVETTTFHSSSSSIETSTLATRNAATFCSEMGMVGTFPADDDTTCTRYYICVIRNEVYLGYSYTCDIPNYFNSITKRCQQNLPENC